MKISLCYWTFLTFTWCRAEKNLPETCLIQIMEKYFQNDSLLFVIRGKNDSGAFGSDSEPDFGSEILKTLMKISKWTFQVSYSDEYSNWPPELKLKRPNKCFFFLEENHLESEPVLNEEIISLKRNPLWNPIGKNVIVLKLSDSTVDEENLARKIFGKLWKLTRAGDILLIIVRGNGYEMNFYTWFPYRDSNCREVNDVVRLDSFKNDRFQRGVNLFPVKLESNLNGCEVIGAADQCVPYVFSHDESGYMEKGVEIQLVTALAEKLNFQLSIIQVTDAELTSPTGMFRFLVDGRVDFAFSCLHLNWDRHLHAQALHPYLYDYLVWFVPSPTLITYASDLISAFSYSMWAAVMVTAVASSLVVIYMTTSGRSETRNSVDSFLKVFAMSLSTPVHFATDHFIFRIFVFLFYIYSFHISIFFQGSLYDHFREPHFTGVYRSVDQAVDEGLYVYLYRSTEHFYNQTNYRLWNKILRPGRHRYIENFEEALRQIAYEKNAIALYIHFAGAYIATVAYRDNNDLPRISWLDEKYSPYPVTMYLSQGSPLFPLFQTQIHRLLGSGLLNYWVGQFVDSRGGVKLRDLRVFSSYGKGPLTWKHLNGSFSLLSTLLLFAFLTFLWELFTFSYEFNPNRRRIDQKMQIWLKKSRKFIWSS